MGCVALALLYLMLSEWIKSWVSMPKFAIYLDYNVIDSKINNKFILDLALGNITNSKVIKNLFAPYFSTRHSGCIFTPYRTVGGVSAIPTRILAFVNRKLRSTDNTFLSNKVIWSPLIWLWLMRSVFASALVRADGRISVNPSLKLFPAPFAYKNRLLGWVWLLIKTIRACLGTKFTARVCLLYYKFLATMQTYFFNPSVGMFTFYRTKFSSITFAVLTYIFKYFAAVGASCRCHRTVSDIVHSEFVKWACHSENSTCQRFMRPLQPFNIISYSGVFYG